MFPASVAQSYVSLNIQRPRWVTDTAEHAAFLQAQF